MPKTLYFQALEDIADSKGEPVVIAGVPCRFRKDRAYEVPTVRNEKLVDALRKMISDGKLAELDPSEAPDLIDAQNAEIRKKRRQRRAKRMAGVAGGVALPGTRPKVKATIETGEAPK